MSRRGIFIFSYPATSTSGSFAETLPQFGVSKVALRFRRPRGRPRSANATASYLAELRGQRRRLPPTNGSAPGYGQGTEGGLLASRQHLSGSLPASVTSHGTTKARVVSYLTPSLPGRPHMKKPETELIPSDKIASVIELQTPIWNMPLVANPGDISQRGWRKLRPERL